MTTTTTMMMMRVTTTTGASTSRVTSTSVTARSGRISSGANIPMTTTTTTTTMIAQVQFATTARTAVVSTKTRRSVRGASVIRRAGSDASARLEKALKEAEECVGECAAMWDDVEELSQAASDSRPVAEESEVKISQADMDFIKATKETLASARAATEVSDDVLKKIEAAAKGMKEVTKKINSSRMAQLDKALDEALAAAKTCTDDCAVAWETVEEISEAKAREN
mmetsp:Transcript_7793/g.28686  ORF Transcript_7793/g.28686 Transcript_7793/m.28686 type:complete len:225 (-) Transcript_7793:126-800(-)